MAIAFGTAVSGEATGAAGITLAGIVVGGSDRALFVGVQNSSALGGQLTTAVTWNGSGTGWVEDWDAVFGSFNAHSGHHFVGPTATTASVVITIAGSGSDEICAGAVPMTGVHQTTAIGTPVAATGSGTTPTVTVSSAAGEVVVDGMTSGAASATKHASQTQIWNEPHSSSFSVSGSSWEAGAASVTMSWTTASQPWGTGAISFKPAGAAAFIPQPMAPVRQAVNRSASF